MDLGELLTRWTIRVALAGYVAGLVLRGSAARNRVGMASARLAWTGGFLAFLLHMVCAFHFYHQWSHHAAYDATARQTEEVVGLAWGGGLWVNYLFALVWGADTTWWWAFPQSYETRPFGVEWAVQGFLAFIAFNATVVFGNGILRWIGLGACFLLLGILGYTALRARRERRKR